MRLHETVQCNGSFESYLPGVRVYLNDAGPVDPFTSPEIFRGEECFDGSLKGWQRWTRPSPEPEPDPELNSIVIASLKSKAERISALHDVLLDNIQSELAGRNILLIAVLRAGIFISAGLAARALSRKGIDMPVAALGLFHDAGLDYQALALALKDHPGFTPVFIDGWTGRGVAVEEIRRSIANYPCPASEKRHWRIATLVDPGHYGDIWAADRDMLIDCAHFSAPEVLGFSRAFIERPGYIWNAYAYPDTFRNQELIDAWMQVFKHDSFDSVVKFNKMQPQKLGKLLDELTVRTGTAARDWKVNCNEVARTFVNRRPQALWLGLSPEEAVVEMPAFIYLAARHNVEIHYAPWMGERHNCLAAVRLR